MIGASERKSAEFLEWEARGRGHAVWPHPVSPEPPFEPFLGRRPKKPVANYDDGRRETFLSSLVRQVSEKLAPPQRRPDEPQNEESVPDEFVRGEVREIQAYLPSGLKFDSGAYASFFSSLSTCVEPVAFEIIATSERIVTQFSVSSADESLVRSQLGSFFPEVSFAPAHGSLEGAWGGEGYSAVVEFGYGREFVVPLDCGRGDPFVGLVGALGQLASGEAAIFQVIFSRTAAPWRDSVLHSVTHADGSALFVNAPELLPAAKEKVALPLYAAVVRVAVKGETPERAWSIACDVAGALGAYGSVGGNELIPLENREYPAEAHEEDIFLRQSRRSGMILNASELAGFVHLPSSDVKSPLVRRALARTKSAPMNARRERGLRLGANSHAGSECPVVLSSDQRARHVHVIGASGTGKSTLLYNCIMEDIENGEGVSVLDPHGDLIDRILGAIPAHRLADVVLLDPSDEESIVGFNILSAHSDWEKSLLAADLVAVFRRLSSAWGDQLNSVLSNALLAFMESDRGGTLLDVRRFLLEPAFRNEFLSSVRDPNVVYYWQKAFPQLSGNKSVGPVVTRLDAFLSPKPIRYMVGQKVNRLDFGGMMDSGKIFLAKLSQGTIGAENAHLLGSLIVSKMQAEAMARQRQAESSRRYHWLYIDEFHDFLTPSLAACLSGVRKYRLGLILSHQEMRQVERDQDVASALLNAYTRIVFRVNDRDARALESGFSSFEASDIQNLETGHAICRVERSDWDFNVGIDLPEYPDDSAAWRTRAAVVAAVREKYGTPRADVELALAKPAEPLLSRREKGEKPTANPSVSPIAVAEPEPPLLTVVREPPQRTISAVAPERLAEPSRHTPQPVASVSQPPAPAIPAAGDLGKGGAQHKAIQKRIRETAEALGFRATIEKAILDGAGSIDLALERSDVSFACEITISTTIDHEVGNVAKCAKAGWKRIAAIAVAPRKLVELEQAVAGSLGPEVAHLVTYYLPDAFIEHLRKLPPPAPTPPEVKKVKGYKVKTVFPKLSPAEAKAKEDAALSLMAGLMKTKRRGG